MAEFLHKKNKRRLAQWVLILISIMFCFMTMLYKDNLTNANFGYHYINSIFTGKFKDYYNAMDWSYGIVIYTIYAIWSIPVCIVNHIIGTDNLMRIPILLWYKFLLAIFAAWSVYLIGKIVECFYEDKKEEIQLQYVSSALFIFPIFAIAQCDIMGLCFVLLGINAYLREENKKFIIYFAIAVTMKYFALFVFIPLVLYRYRRLNKLAGVLVAGAVLIVISILLITNSYAGGVTRADDTYYVNRHIMALNDVNVQIGANGTIGLLGFFYMLLCVIAYIAPNSEKTQRIHYALWLAFSGYMCFFLFYNCNIYWYVLIAPFLILISYSNPKKRKINLILELIFTTTVLLRSIYTRDWVFMGDETFSYIILRHYGVAPTGNLIQVTLNIIIPALESYLPIIQGITYATAFMLLIISFPAVRFHSDELEEETEQDVRIITWIRIAVIYAWILLAVLGLVKSQKSYWFDGNATIEATVNGLYSYECQYSGDVYGEDDTDGVWIGEQFDIQLHLESEVSSDLQLTTYGCAVNSDDEIKVYVDSEYIGNLEKEDETLNTTTRYIIIPKDLIPQSGNVTVALKTMPDKSIMDDDGNDVPLGLYFENIYIKEVQK